MLAHHQFYGQKKTHMKNIIVFLSISIASGILFVNLYTSLIDAKSWGTDIPNSIAAAREYFKAVNPEITSEYFLH